ncbi:histidinol-phosphate transaminase [Candidatus Woesearchaeota archaeon]|nr:histidinol-phosphate transaminase [Candidatus Woesearchaeota archaeon]
MIKSRKAVIEMEEYSPPTSDREDYLRLDFNENTIGCSPNVIKALKSIKPLDLATYPEYKRLREELAAYCKVDMQEVLPTNGTDEAIKTIIETYIEKGEDEVIIPVPTFAMFKFYAQLNEAIIKEALYNEDLSFPTKRVLNEINKKTKIVVLVNPNNPTGTSIRKNDITKIIKKAQKNEAIVVIDEAYYQFYDKTSVPLIKKYDNLLITQTFSKAFGLAGLRLGYIISNKNNVETVQKVLSPYSINNAAVVCALAALKDLNYLKNYVKEVKEGKIILYKALKYLGIKYYKSDANFILLKIGQKAAYFYQKLREDGILVRDRSADQLLEGCIRVTIGTKNQTKKLITTLYKIIKKINPLLIFDIDGVLVDVSKSYRIAIKQTAEYFMGEKVSLEKIQSFKNKGGYNNDWSITQAIIKSKGKNVEKKKIIKKFQDYYNKLVDNEKWLLDKNILKILSNRYNLAILTGRPKKEAEYVLRRNKVKDYFLIIIAMENISKQKPNPNGLLKIMKKYSNQEAYYFGDTIDDMKAAISADIMPIGVLPPQDKSSKLQNLLIKNSAKCVINNINNVMEVLQ